MIILEGPDGAGKSTLGQTLAATLGLPLVHTGGRTGKMKDRAALYDFVEDTLDDPNENIIFDRFPLISEQVYGPVFRGKNDFDNVFGQDMMIKFLNRQPAYVYVRLADTRRMVDNMRMQGVKDHKPPELIEKVVKYYELIVQRYDNAWGDLEGKVPHRQYDFEHDSIEQLVDWCRRYGKIA